MCMGDVERPLSSWLQALSHCSRCKYSHFHDGADSMIIKAVAA